MPKTPEENAAIKARIRTAKLKSEARMLQLDAARSEHAAAMNESEEGETVAVLALDDKGRARMRPDGRTFETQQIPAREYRASDLRRRKATRQKLREGAEDLRQRAKTVRQMAEPQEIDNAGLERV